MNLHFLKLTTLFLVLWTFPTLFSFGQQYNFINYSVEEGLAQSQVRSIFQDNQGYLWVGTLGGISRFDGNEFINYSVEDGLLNNEVNTVIQDSKNIIWIGTKGGVTRFNGTAFENFKLKDGWDDNYVIALAEDKEGNIWFGTDGQGACRLQQGSKTLDYFDLENGLGNNYVKSIFVGDEGKLWFGTESGITFFENGAFVKPMDLAISESIVNQIIQDREGNIWFATFGDGVFKFDGNQFTNYTKYNGLINNWIRSISEDSTGNIWFASKIGLGKFNGSTFGEFNKSDGLPNENIKYVMCGAEGNLWIGTDGNGVVKFTGEEFVNFTIAEGLSTNIVMSITEDRAGNIWCSTYGKGVCQYLNDEFSCFTHDPSGASISNNTIWSSLTDSKGNLWFGTSNGVTKYDGSTFSYLYPEDGLIYKRVTAILEDKAGNLWFGTKEGVSRYDGESITNYSSEQGLFGKNVRDIHEDRAGTLWFATKNGLFKFDGSAFTHFDKEDGLSDNIVYNISEDKNGNLWLGTAYGLTFYNKQQFESLTLASNHSANHIIFSLFDATQNLWLGTDNGVYKMNTEAYLTDSKLEIEHYTNLEGIKSLECNQNAAFRDSKNNLWFGTSRGLVKYSPDKKQSSTSYSPKVYITELKLFLEDTEWEKFTKDINPATGLPENLVVKHNQNHITFHYTGINHTNPKKVRYKFMLDGFDDHWSPVTKATFTTYSNLPNGEYTFRVKASNKEGVWSEEEATYSFTILPPFWITWWFLSLCVIAGLGILYLIYKWRLKVEERKRQTQQLVDQSKMLALEQQTLNSHMNRHFIFNALNSIQYYINMQDKLSANIYLSSFAQLVRKNLDSAQKNLVSLSEEMERLELYLSLEHMRFTDKFEYDILIDEELDSEGIKVPSMLLQPYVENSIRHGILPMEKQGKIDVRVSTREDNLIFSIDDNGIGVITSLKSKKNGSEDHVSQGMRITRERIDLLRKMSKKNIFINGPLELKDDKSNTIGTRVEIVMPIKTHDIFYN